MEEKLFNAVFHFWITYYSDPNDQRFYISDLGNVNEEDRQMRKRSNNAYCVAIDALTVREAIDIFWRLYDEYMEASIHEQSQDRS